MPRLPVHTSFVALLAIVVGFSIGSSNGASATGQAAKEAMAVDVAASAAAPAIRVKPPQPPATASGPAGTSADSLRCPVAGNGAVIDRATQRAWLCTDGRADTRFPITTAVSQPGPGTYTVYAKDRVTTSTFGGHFSYLDNFVAFTRGKRTGARIAFHAVPRNAAGDPFQPYDTVGDRAWYGDSSGCIRVLPDESELIWNHLAIGDTVVVIS